VYLARAIAEFTDAQFVDESIAAVANVNPASITKGLTPIPASGSTSVAAEADIGDLIAAYLAGGARLERAALLMSSANATYLRLSGNRAFEQLTPAGGFVGGIPTFASQAIGNRLILIDQARVLFADDGRVDFAVAEAAALEMSDSPSSHAGTPTAANLASLYQTGAVALRISRVTAWQALENAVQFVQGASYGLVGSPS
jgi:hypothetical protein